MDRTAENIRRLRTWDWTKDPNPEHWKTINGAKVHLDKNGNYDGGAHGKFNGNHHYGGPDWRQKAEQVKNLRNALAAGIGKKQPLNTSTSASLSKVEDPVTVAKNKVEELHKRHVDKINKFIELKGKIDKVKQLAERVESAENFLSHKNEKVKIWENALKKNPNDGFAKDLLDVSKRERAQAEAEYKESLQSMEKVISKEDYKKLLSEFELNEKELDQAYEEEKQAKREYNKMAYKHSPDAVGIFKRGAPMEEEKANGGHVNPNLEKDELYKKNCQTCVVAYELRKRGFDVTAKPKITAHQKSLATDSSLAWIDPETGDKPEYIRPANVKTELQVYNWLKGTLKSGERYTLGWRWSKEDVGHIVHVRLTDSKDVEIYDPQAATHIVGKEAIRKYMESVAITYTTRDPEDYYKRIKKTDPNLRLMRVDHLLVNTDYVSDIFE